MDITKLYYYKAIDCKNIAFNMLTQDMEIMNYKVNQLNKINIKNSKYEKDILFYHNKFNFMFNHLDNEIKMHTINDFIIEEYYKLKIDFNILVSLYNYL